jgi:hypothetical protein
MKKYSQFIAVFFVVCLAWGAVVSTTYAASKTVPTSSPETSTQVEAKVRTYFKDIPVMIEIARCESEFRQFTDAGTVLKGGSAGGMIGIFQFFESIHATPAKALGSDITTLEGNLEYARHLYELQGTTPWNPAKNCWDMKPAVIKAPVTHVELEAKIEQLTQLIKLLKQLQELKAKQAK